MDDTRPQGWSALNRGLSIYLDLVRLLAATEVFLFHMRRFEIGVPAAWWTQFVHEAVTVFFVLSGYLITYAARERDRDLQTYVVSRCTRILSVAVPAVLLTIAFDAVGRHLDPTLYKPFPFDYLPVRLLTGLTMTSQSWVDVQLFSNTPLWSIAYEFWYYFLFAALAFLAGRARLIMLVVVALIAGLKIRLLFPIWWMGSYAYTHRWSARLPRAVWFALAAVPLGAFVAYALLDATHLLSRLFAHAVGAHTAQVTLHNSHTILADLTLGLLVSAHFIGMRYLGPTIEPLLARIKGPIRWGAGYSFTLYALHQPALLLGAALIGARLGGTAQPLAIGAFVCAVVWTIGTLTEQRRERLKPLFGALYQRFFGRFVTT